MMVASKTFSAFYTCFVIFISYNFGSSLNIPNKRSSQQLNLLPLCESDAICGSVQLTSRGVTALPLCSCSDQYEACPLVWDMTDPRSVNQGSIQYKHCTGTSRRISQCVPDQTAYTMQILTPFSEDEEEDMKISHKIHCTCPVNHQHTQQGENVERIPFLGELKTFSLSCAPYPVCGPNEACKTQSETKTSFMENEVCRCSPGTHCPVAGNRRAKSFDFGVGTITQLFCQ